VGPAADPCRFAAAAGAGAALCGHHRAERTLCADPANRARQVASAWNWACKNVPGWRGQLLERNGLSRAESLDRMSEEYDKLTKI